MSQNNLLVPGLVIPGPINMQTMLMRGIFTNSDGVDITRGMTVITPLGSGLVLDLINSRESVQDSSAQVLVDGVSMRYPMKVLRT